MPCVVAGVAEGLRVGNGMKAKVALAFSTKDRVELSERSIEPLLGIDADLFMIDGSVTEEGMLFPGRVSMRKTAHDAEEQRIFQHLGIRGGPDAAVAYALTVMLADTDYTHVGLIENDVLLPMGWFEPTMALFERGRADFLPVGSVSARTFCDRILFQRDGYAVMHNLGWGMMIMTREAAQLALRYFRTHFTLENRRVFWQLAGKDIGLWWAFRANEHALCADWGNERMLATHGLAALAPVPSHVEMIGQVPPLAEQGLAIAATPQELLKDDAGFETYRRNLHMLRSGALTVPRAERYYPDAAACTYLPHFMDQIGGHYGGRWKLKWMQALGPFAWEAVEDASLQVPVSGSCAFLVSGGKDGGGMQLIDEHSGYIQSPALPPEGESCTIVAFPIPGDIGYRRCTLQLTPGTRFYGLRTREVQPHMPDIHFSWHTLPKV